MRICSLLPGATEVVAALGLADQLVGISHECDYPATIRDKPVMVVPAVDSTGSSPVIDQQVSAALQAGQSLYQLRDALFVNAAPDLVITQDLCHVCAVTPSQLERAIQALPSKPAVLTLNPMTLREVIDDVERIGGATKRATEAQALAATLRSRLAEIRDRVAAETARPRVVCLEWLAPLFIGGHWVPDMVEAAGGLDVLGVSGAPSRRVTVDHIHQAKPDLIVLMPCGFSVDRIRDEAQHLTIQPQWIRLPAVQAGRVFAVDASSYFSRPGPRLVDGVAILAQIMYPTAFDGTRPDGMLQIQSLPNVAHR